MQQPTIETAQQGSSSELRSDAQELGNSAKERVLSEADARKGAAATQVKSVSSAIQRAAGELDDGAPDWLRSAFQQGADQIQRFADALEQKDSRQLVGEVQSFARERPGAFLGACAAAGFAAARILKAGGEQQGTSSQLGQSRSAFPSEPAFQPSEPQSEFQTSSPGGFA
jgi:ElaB/YqjD/DUF883 family membrane-anchored ribosome-binding protein